MSQYLDNLESVSSVDEKNKEPYTQNNVPIKINTVNVLSLLEAYVRRFESVMPRLFSVERDVQNLRRVSKVQRKYQRIEAFVTYLLYLLQQRGDVVAYGWYRMYKEGQKIDGLGLDQWCWLADRYGGGFCPINSKSSSLGLERHEKVQSKKKGWRRVVLLFFPGMDPQNDITDEEVSHAADQLLEGLISRFGNGHRHEKGMVDK